MTSPWASSLTTMGVWLITPASRMDCKHPGRIWLQIAVVKSAIQTQQYHDDVIAWKYFPRYWPFVRGFHRPLVDSSHKGQWRGALMFSLICARTNDWLNNAEVGDLRRHHTHYDVTVIILHKSNAVAYVSESSGVILWICNSLLHVWTNYIDARIKTMYLEYDGTKYLVYNCYYSVK